MKNISEMTIKEIEDEIKMAKFDYGIWDNVVFELQALYPSYASISLTADKAHPEQPITDFFFHAPWFHSSFSSSLSASL